MMKKRLVCLALTIFLSLSGYVGPMSAETNFNSSPITLSAEQILEEYVKVLTSEAFGGRKTGSFGNDLTAEWLCERLESIGIAPYQNDDYKMGFTTMCYNFARLEMRVYEKGGRVRSFVAGEDFYTALTANFDVKLKEEDVTFISLDDTIGFVNVKYAFQEVNAFSAVSYVEKRTPQYIQVTSDTFCYLTETDIEYIHIINEVITKEREVYNIVGMIPGTNPQKSVVLSAHFDHMGRSGESYFQGAVDNASGTAALLYIAELLAQMSKESPFDFDIVIALCNEEESGAKGSRMLVPVFGNKYENWFNINFDCVGIGGGNDFYLLPDNYKYRTLAEDIKLYMDKYEILYKNDPANLYLSTDGRNFYAYNIPTISLIADGTDGLIHTNFDTYDKLDYMEIANLCRMVAEFVADNGSNVYEATVVQSTSTSLPEHVLRGFEDLVERILSGSEAYFDDEQVSYMAGVNRNLYTYHDYLQISANISTVRDFNGYHLGFVEQYSSLPIARLQYLKDVPYPENNAIEISVAPYFTYNTYDLVPIEGMEGYYSVSTLMSGRIIGFAYIDDNTYLFRIGRLTRADNYVALTAIPVEELTLDYLKAVIEDLNVEIFIEMWKDYNLNL